MKTLTQLVKNNTVHFDSYRAGFFYYYVAVRNENILDADEMYQFTVPLDDVGNATLLSEDKAITFMRWIRKAQDNGELIKL